MERVDPSGHAWFTYWLIIVKDKPYGSGRAGFKGSPDDQGKKEIGYGIECRLSQLRIHDGGGKRFDRVGISRCEVQGHHRAGYEKMERGVQPCSGESGDASV